MTWHRGFVICSSSDAAEIRRLIEGQAQVSLLADIGGESAFAFSSRIVPELGQHPALLIGVEDGVAAYSLETCQRFCPTGFVLRLGLTFGLVVARDCAATQSAELQGQVAKLGQPSDQGEEDGLIGLRWDLECGIGDPAIQAFSRSLNEIESVLTQAGERYRIATFEGWNGQVRGGLDEVADVWGSPIVIAVIEWPGAYGDTNRVTANDSEFVVESDELADSDLL